MYPPAADPQAIFAALGARSDVADKFQMRISHLVLQVSIAGVRVKVSRRRSAASKTFVDATGVISVPRRYERRTAPAAAGAALHPRGSPRHRCHVAPVDDGFIGQAVMEDVIGSRAPTPPCFCSERQGFRPGGWACEERSMAEEGKICNLAGSTRRYPCHACAFLHTQEGEYHVLRPTARVLTEE
jgi:hypothetical protein